MYYVIKCVIKVKKTPLTRVYCKQHVEVDVFLVFVSITFGLNESRALILLEGFG